MSLHLIGRRALAWVVAPMLVLTTWNAGEPRPAAAGGLERAGGKWHPPGWIWKAFGSAGHDGHSCKPASAGMPLPPIIVKRLDKIDICIQGFASGDKPILHLTTPAGTRIDWPGEVNDKNVWELDWTQKETKALLHDPGDYRFTITAANTAPTTGLIVVDATAQAPAVISWDPDYEVRRGATVTVMVGGFPPGAPIYSALYRDEDVEHRRMTLLDTLPDVVADSFGEGVVHVTVTDDMPLGRFIIYIPTPSHVDDPADAGVSCYATCEDFEVVS